MHAAKSRLIFNSVDFFCSCTHFFMQCVNNWRFFRLSHSLPLWMNIIASQQSDCEKVNHIYSSNMHRTPTQHVWMTPPLVEMNSYDDDDVAISTWINPDFFLHFSSCTLIHLRCVARIWHTVFVRIYELCISESTKCDVFKWKDKPKTLTISNLNKAKVFRWKFIVSCSLFSVQNVPIWFAS